MVADSDGCVAGAEDFSVGFDEEWCAVLGAVERAANHAGDGCVLREGQIAPAGFDAGFAGGKGVKAGVAESEAAGGWDPGDAEPLGEGIAAGAPAIDL